MTTSRSTATPHLEITDVWVHLSDTVGWDVRVHKERSGALIAHFEDWHRLERSMARQGLRACLVDSASDE